MQQKILEANGQNASIKNDYDESMQFSLRDINNAILFFLFLSLFVLFVCFFFFFWFFDKFTIGRNIELRNYMRYMDCGKFHSGTEKSSYVKFVSEIEWIR